MVSGPSKIYGSVKSFSARGKLLSKSELQTLAESRDLEELVTRIKDTLYVDAVAKLTKPITAEKIESALRSHLADTHYSIAKTTGDSNILEAYYLKFLVWNLKLILKGKALEKSYEEIEPNVNLHAEELIGRRDVIVKALVAKDLEEAVSNLSGSEFGDEVSKAATLYKEKNNLQAFDTYLDKIFYKNLQNALRETQDRTVIQLIGLDIDFYNLLSVIRGKFWELDEQQILDLIVATTPSAPRDLLGSMINTGSVKEALGELTNTYYKNLVPETDNALDAITEFERNFEIFIYKAVNRTFSRMFSFATVIGIIKLTSYEIRNLAAIAFAVEQKIPTERTMEKLIVSE